MFVSESEMIESSLEDLCNTFSDVQDIELLREVDGLFGVPDIVMFTSRVISIEYKLSNWKRALQQAFKYKSFSNQSFVFMDETYFHRAKKNIDLFKRSNIGLGYVQDGGTIEIYYCPDSTAPFSDSMYNKLLEKRKNAEYKVNI